MDQTIVEQGFILFWRVANITGNMIFESGPGKVLVTVLAVNFRLRFS
jgi:hypothetical protein